jgi:hypothetical protein
MEHRQKKLNFQWLKKLFAVTEAKIAIKTGIAASLSLIVGLSYSKVFDRPDTLVSGLWCVMASIVVMQAHLGGTYRAAWVRFLGVLIGSIAGTILIHVVGAGALSLGVSVSVTIVLCALLNIKDSFRIAALSTALIIIMGGLHPTTDIWLFSLYRFLDSCIGILIAIAVARLIWPNKAVEDIRRNISKILTLLSKYFRIAVSLETKTEVSSVLSSKIFEEITELLEENKDYDKEAEIELFDNVALREHWTALTTEFETVFEAIDILHDVQKETLSKIFDDSLANRLSDVIEQIDQAFQSLEKSIGSPSNSLDVNSLRQSLTNLNGELLRFRETRRTRKFNMEDVESFFVFFYSLRSIGEMLIKMEKQATI